MLAINYNQFNFGAMKKTGFIIIIVSLVVIAAAYGMKFSADARFAERTENIYRIRKNQRETTGTEYTGSNFYSHPDPERKAFWNTVWNFSLPLGIVSTVIGGMLIFRSKRHRESRCHDD